MDDIFNEKFVLALENGIKLYTNRVTSGLSQYANEKKLRGYRFFLAVDPQGYRELLMVQGIQPVFASTKLEDVAAHIDILAMTQEK